MHDDERSNAHLHPFLNSFEPQTANDPGARVPAVRAPRQLSLPGFRDHPRSSPTLPVKVARWVLRTLIGTEALAQYAGKQWRAPTIEVLLGRDEGERPLEGEALRRRALRRLEEVEGASLEVDGPLQANIAMLAHALHLSALECELLELRCQYWTQPPIRELFDAIFDGGWSDERLVRVLAVTFDVEPDELWWLLDPERPLFRSGLINLGTSVNENFTGKLAIQRGLSNALQHSVEDLHSLLSFALCVAPAATLACDDFPQLAAELRTLTAFLRVASRDRLPGVNVLVYGPPGVGKTELSRAVSAASGLRAFEVAAENRDGEHLELADRLVRYRMLQALLGDTEGAAVVLDDIDNAFAHEPARFSHASLPKAWLNQLLEHNPLPAFWIANSIQRIDPAYVRRFDMVLEVKAPPRSIRKRILHDCFAALPVGDDWIDRQAENAGVTPAVAARAARVLRTLDSTNPSELHATYATLVRGHQRAIGARAPTAPAPAIADYRPEWLNVDADIAQLLEALRRRPQGRLLFHGPPGTGKTALAQHLARSIDRPLLTKRASDLISMWLGGTEKNLSEMFEEAAADGAVLLLDEADSFLQDRRLAIRSWEVTEVNELLTQMEGFQGLFICATNFLERLDSAALRRFGLKLAFRPLRPEQAAALFAAYYRRIAGCDLPPADAAGVERELARLAQLTPGDFASVAGQWELRDRTPSPTELLDALRQECALKPGGGRAMRF